MASAIIVGGAAFVLAGPSSAAVPGPLSWGSNQSGELGDGVGGGVGSNVPVYVAAPGGATFVAMSGGGGFSGCDGRHSVALTSAGAVYAWGDNSCGELGNGTTGGNSLLPVLTSLPGGVTATAVSAGGRFDLALTSTGAVYAWGANGEGELGDGSNSPSNTPVLVSIPGGVTITAISAGYNWGLALTDTGTIYSWGNNAQNQLGNGNNTNSNTPALTYQPPGAVFTQVAAGGYYNGSNLALGSDGTVYGWGSGVGGQSVIPAPMGLGMPNGVVANQIVNTPGGNGYVLASNGTVYSWGNTSWGGDGNGSNGSVNPVNLPGGVTPVAVAGGGTNYGSTGYVLTSVGTIYAWGANDGGALGTGAGCCGSWSPALVSLPAGVAAVAVGAGFGTGFAVTKVAQTVNFNSSAPSNAVVDGPTYVPSASASSGLSVTITVDGSSVSVCSISGGVVSFIGQGICQLDADQSGNGTYAPAPRATQSFAVSKTTTSVTTSLSGGLHSGTSISVPIGTPVTDQANLSGQTAGAGGTVTYTVYSDAACTVSVASGGTIAVSSGSAGASNPVTINTAGTYYWQASYSGDSLNGSSASTCGPGDEVVTVPQNTTSVTTSLSGASHTGTTISVPVGTPVDDQATLSGATSGAGGSVTFTVYSDSACTVVAGSGGTEPVTNGSVPVSSSVTLAVAGTYYWKAAYSGDTNNASASSTCGPSGEVEIVHPLFYITTAPQLTNATRGQTYSAQLNASGGTLPYKWKKLNPLPKGLKLVSGTGVISGIPSTKTTAGTYVVRIEVLDHSKPKKSAIQTFSLTLS